MGPRDVGNGELSDDGAYGEFAEEEVEEAEEEAEGEEAEEEELEEEEVNGEIAGNDSHRLPPSAPPLLPTRLSPIV